MNFGKTSEIQVKGKEWLRRLQLLQLLFFSYSLSTVSSPRHYPFFSRSVSWLLVSSLFVFFSQPQDTKRGRIEWRQLFLLPVGEDQSLEYKFFLCLWNQINVKGEDKSREREDNESRIDASPASGDEEKTDEQNTRRIDETDGQCE